MKVPIELEVEEATGFVGLHETLATITDSRSTIKSVSLSLTGTELYFWSHTGKGHLRLNLVPIIQAVIGATSPEEENNDPVVSD